MDWTALNFDWNRARAFLVSAEEGSFSGAARALRSTQPTVSRQVAALEAELDVTLFERVGGGLEVTQAGLDLLEHARAMGDAAIRLSLAATGQSESIEGRVCITASEAIATYLLPPILQTLRVAYPGIELDLVVSNEPRDLHRREADIAVRNFRTPQPDLIGRKLRDVTAHFYAAPSYVARMGGLDTAEDLARVELFAFDRTDTMVDGLKALGLHVQRSQFPITTANHLVQWALCKQGAGVCMMMDEVGARDPDVVRVFPELPSIRLPMWLVSHRELRTSRRIRLVYDWLAEGLSAGPQAQS
ncbi:MAG: DNA-binding transcriptional LysR family regulator [Myxococcota bacterium]|jgi:DNA-binding transcriptional LysR family regulator